MINVFILIAELTEPGYTLDGRVLQIFAASCTMVFTLIEIGCYVIIFHHLFKHDNGRITAFLSQECTRHRNRSNAITFIGQFYGFWTEFVFMVILTICIVLGKSNIQMKALVSVIKFIEFGILSAIEVLTSETLREVFIESIFSMTERIFFKFFWF